MKENKVKLKIGDEIYKYLTFSGFAKYIVIGIKIVPKCIMYEIECQACKDHEKCTMYVVEDTEKGKYKFVCMTNNIGEDEDGNEIKPQHYWHNDDCFYSDLQEGRKELYEKCIKQKKEQIEKQQKGIENLNKELNDLEEHYKNILSV